jgi:uncharacterized SAM-binding protein YcdF (DUF218 family)
VVGGGSAGSDGTGSRRRRLRPGRVLTAVALLLLGYVAVTFVQVARASAWEATGSADAAVVLGAAQYDGRPSPVLRARLDHGLELWRDGRVGQIVLTGSRREGDRYTEAYAGFQYLRTRGVPESDLVIVDTGTSTWESLAASERVLRRERIDSVILVSDAYHSFRLVGIAEELGMDAQVSPTGSGVALRPLARETAAVSLGRLIGYRRTTRLLGGTWVVNPVALGTVTDPPSGVV